MSQINREFLFDTALVISTVLITSRLLYLRINRESYMQKNKYHSGMSEYETINKLTRIHVLILATIITLLLIARLIFVVHSILGSSDSNKQFILIFVPTAAIVLGAFGCYIAYKSFGKEKPKHTGKVK